MTVEYYVKRDSDGATLLTRKYVETAVRDMANLVELAEDHKSSETFKVFYSPDAIKLYEAKRVAAEI